MPQPGTIRDVFITAAICAVFSWRLHRQRLRHEREMRDLDKWWRQHYCRQQKPLPPPGHPDWETALSDDEKNELGRIAARFNDEILDSEGGP